jgi:hypothetical protein
LTETGAKAVKALSQQAIILSTPCSVVCNLV